MKATRQALLGKPAVAPGEEHQQVPAPFPAPNPKCYYSAREEWLHPFA